MFREEREREGSVTCAGRQVCAAQRDESKSELLKTCQNAMSMSVKNKPKLPKIERERNRGCTKKRYEARERSGRGKMRERDIEKRCE